jgi:protease-4
MAQSKVARCFCKVLEKSGKFTSFTLMHILKRILLNSVADKIYINPVGEMDFKGLSSETQVYKGLQEKLVKWKSFATENKSALNLS